MDKAERVAKGSFTKRQLWLAAGAGAMILVVTGIGFRVLADHYERAYASVPIPADTLESLPMRIGPWQGRPLQLDERMVQMSDTDAHLSRYYQKVGRSESAILFVGYGLRLRDLMPHRPEICYPGAGWTILDRRYEQITTQDGQRFACQLFLFARGALQDERLVVLNYYIVDGQYAPDVSLLRRKSGVLTSSAQYSAQIQIVAAVQGDGNRGRESLLAFTALVADDIYQVITQAVGQAQATVDTLSGHGRNPKP